MFLGLAIVLVISRAPVRVHVTGSFRIHLLIILR